MALMEERFIQKISIQIPFSVRVVVFSFENDGEYVEDAGCWIVPFFSFIWYALSSTGTQLENYESA